MEHIKKVYKKLELIEKYIKREDLYKIQKEIRIIKSMLKKEMES